MLVGACWDCQTIYLRDMAHMLPLTSTVYTWVNLTYKCTGKSLLCAQPAWFVYDVVKVENDVLRVENPKQ